MSNVTKLFNCDEKLENFKTLYTKFFGKEMFEKATKVELKDYKNNFIYDLKTDKFFEEVDILREYYESEDLEPPKYVLGCTKIKFSLDMFNLVEDELYNNHYEDAFEHIDKDSLKDLQEMVDKWCDSQGIVSYEEDCNTIVILDK